ncbi:MAG: S9 family peptidase [Clostridiales bacterium]|jgi:dipeptidyl aminopeptidase/acylaminoacyl peptidase|nr:S9 family peptidase [Clostridiales bacterium]
MEHLKIDDFKNYTFLSNLSYSPGGESAAVLAAKANDKNGYHKTIFVDKGDGYFPLTSVSGNVGQYIWLDDAHILFSEIRNEETKKKQDEGREISSFHKICIHGGEAAAAFDVEATVTDIKLRADGSFIMNVVYDGARPSFEGKSDWEAAEILKQLKKEKSYQVVDELPFWFDGKGFTNKKRSRLYQYSAEGKLTALTGPLDNVLDYKLSPCGNYILLDCEMAPYEISSVKSNLYLLDIKGGETKKLLDEDMFIEAFDFYRDKFVLAASKGENYNFHEHPAFYLIDKDGAMRKLCDYDRSIGSAAMSDSKFSGGHTSMVHDDGFYFLSLHDFRADVFRLCLKSGEISNALNSGGNVDFFDINGGKIIYAAMKGLSLQEIYEADEKKSSFNDAALAGKKLSVPRHHVITDKDGYKIDGWVMKPVDFEQGKTYPAILNIHGGPKAAYGDSFFHEMQYWAGRGYFVMFCNPRGSDGKGNDFAEIRGKYGTVDYENIMQFADEMCDEYPAVNRAKMGVTGGSYGGFMTNWIIGQPKTADRFAAAATQRSICNWISFSYVSDIGYFFGPDQQGAHNVTDPADVADKMWQHSPLKYAANVTTPTLILHSDEDYRCWIPEAYQWFTALKLNGVETRLHIFRGEGHELSRSGKPDHRERRIKEITDWMDKFCK